MPAINTRQHQTTNLGDVTMELLLAFGFFGLADAMAYNHGCIHTVAYDLQFMEGGLHKQQIGQVSLHSFSTFIFPPFMHRDIRRSIVLIVFPPLRNSAMSPSIFVPPHVLSVT